MKILYIPDDHGAYHHPDEYDFLRDIKQEYKPDITVHLGDEADCHWMSNHPKNPECYGPEDEARLNAEHIQDLAKLFPKVHVCNSNHPARLQKAAAHSHIAMRYLKAWDEAMEAPRGWKWADSWTFGKVKAFHGDGYLGKSAIESAIIDHGCSVVFGHLHSQGAIEHHRRAGWNLWGMCAGCLIDPDSPAMAYGKTHRKKLILGCGLVIDGVPMFVPLS